MTTLRNVQVGQLVTVVDKGKTERAKVLARKGMLVVTSLGVFRVTDGRVVSSCSKDKRYIRYE